MMKKLLIFCAVLFMVTICTSAMAAYTVDLGSSEPYPMADWGKIWPPNGGWGGFGSGGDNYTPPTTPTADWLCRTVWGINDSRIATITFPTPITAVTIRHLDGLALDTTGGGGDDFEVYVDYVPWGGYVSNPATNEYWVETAFSGTPGTILMIIATDPQWSGFGSWGQLGIDRIVAIPEPATIMLLGLGGLALLKKRRS